MKRTKRLSIVAALFACLLVFGAWTPNTAAVAEEERYGEAQFIATYANEVIAYTDRQSIANTTPKNAPTYYGDNSLTNGCGAVAGAIVVGYYDKYFPNLIPGWVSHYSSGTYRMQDATYVPALERELYDLMQTNVAGSGVSEAECKDGLAAYVHSKGYSIQYGAVANGSSIDYNACKATIDEGKVILLFMHAGDLYSVSRSDGYDTVIPTTVTSSHIMVAYGYQEINYYNNGVLFRTDRYLNVCTGQIAGKVALYKISPHNLAAAYAITIS